MRFAIPLLALFALSITGAGAVETGLPTTASTVPYRLSLNFTNDLNDASLGTSLDMVRASGGKFIREELDSPRGSIETTTIGTYDFSYYDRLSAACAARGIRIIYTFVYGNDLYGPTDFTSAAWRQNYTNFVAATVQHFRGQGNIYEIWNEPNIASDTSQYVDNYMTLVKQLSPAVRAADPSAPIMGPAIGPQIINSAGVRGYDWLTGCFQQGLLDYVDAVSIHPYAEPATAIPENNVSMYSTVRSLMQTYGGKTVPLISSEWGYSTGTAGITAQLQGDYAARSLLVNMSQGIPLSDLYEFRDQGTDPNSVYDHFGTVTADGVAKPAYNELQLLTRSLWGETFSTKLSDGHSNDWLLVFTGGGHTSLAAWTTRTGGRTVTVSGWGTLHLTATPFYLNPTLLPGDANLDGTVNVQDLAVLAANYRKNVTGGWTQADFNNDGVVDVQDLALLAANYRHSYGSDVVPAYGLDAEAIQALSLAGVTVVPEPAPLSLLVTGLLGFAGSRVATARLFPKRRLWYNSVVEAQP